MSRCFAQEIDSAIVMLRQLRWIKRTQCHLYYSPQKIIPDTELHQVTTDKVPPHSGTYLHHVDLTVFRDAVFRMRCSIRYAQCSQGAFRQIIYFLILRFR